MGKQFKFMVIGAHPDDCEAMGGTAIKLMRAGSTVKFLNATNGCSGHHETPGAAMVKRRMEEAKRVSELFGLEYETLDNNDGFLTTGLREREMVLGAIRKFAPDMIFTHRPNDYHPDHRNTSILVQDCSYLVQVPNVLPTVPPLDYMPVIAYKPDSFKRPYPFTPSLVLDISDVIVQKMRMYDAHVSQVYEWLPWVDHSIGEVPKTAEERFEWLMSARRLERNSAPKTGPWADLIAKRYPGRVEGVKYVEAFELCEYGGSASPELLDEMFPF